MVNNPYAAPESRVEDVDLLGDKPVPAERGSRLAAVILNLVIAFVAFIPMIVAFFPMLVSISRMEPGSDPEQLMQGGLPFLAILSLVAMLVILVVDLVWLYRHGQTIGKRIMNVKIVRRNGARCALWRILVLRMFVNGLPSLIPFVGNFYPLADVLFIFREDNRCLHDHIADTVVVKA